MSFTHSGNGNLLNPKLHWYCNDTHTHTGKFDFYWQGQFRISEYNRTDIKLKFCPVTDNDEAGKNSRLHSNKLVIIVIKDPDELDESSSLFPS